MNRRSFFETLTKAVVGFTILPPATTYSRVWRATPVVITPNWFWYTPDGVIHFLWDEARGNRNETRMRPTLHQVALEMILV